MFTLPARVCTRTLFALIALLWCFNGISWAHHPGANTSLAKAGGTGYLINSPSAATLPKGKWDAGFVFEHTRFQKLDAEEAHELHEEGRDIHDKDHEEFYNMVLGYGVAEDLDFHLTAPIVSRKSVQIESHEFLGQTERSTGFGDTTLVGRWRLWKEGIHASFLGGLKAPTGETSDIDIAGEKFEAELQPGSGSWDGLFGTAFTGFWLGRITGGGSFLYHLRGEGAQDFKFGDSFDLNIGGACALRPAGNYPNVSIVLEFNQTWALKDKSRGIGEVFDSGGYSLVVTPGVTVDVSDSLTFFWGMPLTAYQRLGGEHQEKRFSVLAGTSLSF